tara:strand:- start:436 stop:1089 length:654 start_codon:yes stop_codon:yes gene_type:complete
MVSVPSAYANNDRQRIALCVPVRDHVSVMFTRSLANMMQKCGQEQKPVTLHMNYGSNIVSQRYELAKEALATRADFLLWIDSDMHFPSDLIDKLLNRKAKLIGVPYATRVRPIRSTAFRSNLDYNARLNNSVDPSGLEKVAGLGFGCVLIHRSIFEATDAPWFGLKFDPSTASVMGEDIYFFEKAAEAGFQCYADFELAKNVAHIGGKAYTLEDIEE